MQQKHLKSLGKSISMRRYTVEITDEALADMERLYNHIALKLLAPENAMGQYNRIADEILKLDSLPERFKIIESVSQNNLCN